MKTTALESNYLLLNLQFLEAILGVLNLCLGLLAFLIFYNEWVSEWIIRLGPNPVLGS